MELYCQKLQDLSNQLCNGTTYVSRLNVICHFFHLVNQKDKDILQYFSELSALNNSSVSKLCHLIAPASYQTICKCGISQLVGLFWWFSFPVTNEHLFLLCFISFRELFVQLLYTFPSSYPHQSPMRCFPDCILQMLVDYDTWTCPW